MAVTAFAFAHRRLPGHFTNAGATAHGLANRLGSAAGAMFAIVLLNASMIGAAAVTLATSYAFGDVFGHQALAAPQLRRRETLLRDLRRPGRSRRQRSCSFPARHSA